MSTPEITPEVPAESPQLKEGEISGEELVKNIKKLTLEYNKSLEDLGDAEALAQDANSAVFRWFINKNKASSDEVSYNEIYAAFVENKQSVLQKQTRAFRNLQKLKNDETNYLVGIINNLQTQLNDAKKPVDEAAAGPSTSAPAPTPANPRLASTGKLPA